MKRHTVLLGVLGLAMLGAGCEDPCKKGVTLRNNETTLETVINGTIVQPSTIGNTCADVRKTWDKTLAKGAKFAGKIANDYFRTIEYRCLRDHNERRCDYVPARPYDPTDHSTVYDCRIERVCDDQEMIEHKKDGYDQAISASFALEDTKSQLDQACVAFGKSDTVEALARLVAAKIRLNEAGKNTDDVLVKAGCFDPNRRGD